MTKLQCNNAEKILQCELCGTRIHPGHMYGFSVVKTKMFDPEFEVRVKALTCAMCFEHNILFYVCRHGDRYSLPGSSMGVRWWVYEWIYDAFWSVDTPLAEEPEHREYCMAKHLAGRLKRGIPPAD